MPFIDATAAFSLRELAGALQRRGGRLLLSDVGARVRVDLERHGLIEDLGSDAMHASLAQALAAAVRTSN